MKSKILYHSIAISLLLPFSVYADTFTTNADLLFNWAEATYPALFTGNLESQTLQTNNVDYYYRGSYALASGNSFYAGVNKTTTPHVFILESNGVNDLVDVGTLSALVSSFSYSSNSSSGTPSGGSTPPSDSSTPPALPTDSTGTNTSATGTPPSAPTGTPPSTISTGTAETTNSTNSSSSASSGASGSSSTEVTSCTATYKLETGTEILVAQTITASEIDTSAVCTNNDAVLTLTNLVVNTTGNSSSLDNSSFYGLNAALLAINGSNLTVEGGNITTSGTGANGAFVTGTGSTMSLKDVTIVATGNGGHGVDATLGGAMAVTNVTASTTGNNGSVIATDRGGGTIAVSGGKFTAAGIDSAGIYSTGVITVAGAEITSTNGEAVVIEGGNSAVVTRCKMSAAKGTRDRGMLIYQSTSGDAIEGASSFVVNGGSYTWTSSTGPAIYVTNVKTTIQLNGLEIKNSSATLLKASADSWGTTGSNGGVVTLLANAQTLEGNILADSISSVALTLSNGSVLTGAINNAATAEAATLTLDASSQWNVTADSHLSGLSNSTQSTAFSNIISNGHNVYYKNSESANSWLAGATYALSGGGSLIPE